MEEKKKLGGVCFIDFLLKAIYFHKLFIFLFFSWLIIEFLNFFN